MARKKRKLRLDFNLILCSVIIGVFLFLGLYFSNANITGSTIFGFYDHEIFDRGIVTSVVDGDTIRVQGESVRLLGIDAEERGEECYFAARKRLEELVLDKRVELRAESRDKDRYDRFLRYVYLNGENINIKMVREGLARVMLMEDNVLYRDELFEAERFARENEIGCLWNEIIRESYGGLDLEIDKIDWKKLSEERTGLKVIDACDADRYLGKEVIVEGVIKDSHRHGVTAVFLNMGEVYPNNCFTGVIWYSDWHKFPEDSHNFYYNRIVRIKGEVNEFRGTPQIILRDESQIEAY